MTLLQEMTDQRDAWKRVAAQASSCHIEVQKCNICNNLLKVALALENPVSVNECYFDDCRIYGGFVVKDIRACRGHLNDAMHKMNVCEFYHEFQ